MSETTGFTVTVGRNGIKVPDLTWEDGLENPSENLLWYFHDFWSANGYPPHRPDTNRNWVSDEPYYNKLDVPVNSGRPLVFIQGVFQPRDTRSIEQEEVLRNNPKYNAEDGGWPSYSPIITAVEEHCVSVPLGEVGQFDVLLRVRKTHRTDESAIEEPEINYRGRTVQAEDFQPLDFRSMSMAEVDLAQKTAHRSALEFILRDTFIDYIR